MQKSIKAKTSNSGKMLSSFVNKYLKERHTFDTKVCSYSFGLGLSENADQNMQQTLMNGT